MTIKPYDLLWHVSFSRIYDLNWEQYFLRIDGFTPILQLPITSFYNLMAGAPKPVLAAFCMKSARIYRRIAFRQPTFGSNETQCLLFSYESV